MSAAGKMSGMIEKSGAGIHTAFPAKVLECDGETAKVQPLFRFNGKDAAPISGVPVPQSVRKYEVATETVDGVSTHWTKASPPAAGDIVYCLCAEQTLGTSYKGNPADRAGDLHHQLGDAVVVAIF